MSAKRWLIAVAACLAVSVAVLAALMTGALYLSLPQQSGELHLPGLHDRVTISRDSAGVPVIQAQDVTTVAFALGFVHAQERFFQMDLLRRSAAGELAQLVGDVALPLDKKRRLFLLRKQLAARWQQLPEIQQHVLRRYAEGVNAGLTSLKLRPFEYLLLRTEPQLWQPEDTLLVVGAMYFDLQDNQPEREYARGWIARHSTPEQSDFLLPAASVWDAPLAGQPPSEPPAPLQAPRWWPASGQAQSVDDNAPGEALAQEAKGSNGWLVSEQGKAILANDMHLGLRLPTVWYRAQLRYTDDTGPVVATGLTLPGAPAIVSGSNGTLAWGFTNSYVDTFDWVALKPGEGSAVRCRKS
ncbi:penicillin acylase family protein [Dickeya sp. DW 0440]|uniref:penicillin acylase family protein n=1 Tax=Dickeya sp. DW 0440 TaxID=1225785 RepID=UPI0003AB3099|nr:penicillin acylase family protein [Dickeya sp. DW 0440]